MTQRVCVIGNSHLIMIQKAWASQTARRTADEVVFFGALIRHFSDLSAEPDRGVLAASGALQRFFERSAGGRSEIDPGEYDRFVLVGMRIGVIEIYRALRSVVPSAYAAGAGETRSLLSDDLFRQWVREFFESSTGFEVLRMLCELTEKPVTLVPQPHVAEKFLSTQNGRHLPPPDDSLYAYVDEVYRDAISQNATQAGAQVLFQRDETLVNPGLSSSDYLYGAVSFSGKSFGADDVGHMNADFGRLVLEDLGLVAA